MIACIDRLEARPFMYVELSPTMANAREILFERIEFSFDEVKVED